MRDDLVWSKRGLNLDASAIPSPIKPFRFHCAAAAESRSWPVINARDVWEIRREAALLPKEIAEQNSNVGNVPESMGRAYSVCASRSKRNSHQLRRATINAKRKAL